MGCSASVSSEAAGGYRPPKKSIFPFSSCFTEVKTHGPPQKERGIQDEAYSFRSKIGASRIILKNMQSRQVFIRFCQERGKAEYAQIFHDLDELKSLPLQTLIPQLKLLLRNAIKFQQTNSSSNNSDSATVSVRSIRNSKSQDQTEIKAEEEETDIGVCLHSLKTLDFDKLTLPVALKQINRTQDLILSRVYAEFDEFLKSKELKEVMTSNLEKEKILSQNKIKEQQGLNYSRSAPIDKDGKDPNELLKNSSS